MDLYHNNMSVCSQKVRLVLCPINKFTDALKFVEY